MADKRKIHDTPKLGSWLTRTKIQLSGRQRQCLAQRIPDREAMAEAVTAWAQQRHAARSAIAWQLTTPTSAPSSAASYAGSTPRLMLDRSLDSIACAPVRRA